MVDGAGDSSIFVLANVESILSDNFEKAENNLKGKWSEAIGLITDEFSHAQAKNSSQSRSVKTNGLRCLVKQRTQYTSA